MIRQVGALAYRVRGARRRVEVLLVSSRRTARWIVPKGNIDRDRDPAEMAAIEAYEEGGVEGHVETKPFGRFEYRKFRRPDVSEPARVAVYPLRVEVIHDHWPEMAERERRWVALDEAAGQVGDPDLARLIARFAKERASS